VINLSVKGQTGSRVFRGGKRGRAGSSCIDNRAPELEGAYDASMSDSPSNPLGATLALWMGPQEANVAGFVHGGIIMKLCDEAAGLAAVQYSRQRVVTAAIDRVTFLVPIHLGELVTFSAKVNAAWRTSMEVGVRVDAENPLTGERRHTNTAFLTIVAVDLQGRPTAVPSLEVADAEGARREREAQMRRENRLAERERIRDAQN
jgi:acyl-CoA hydrolase